MLVSHSSSQNSAFVSLRSHFSQNSAFVSNHINHLWPRKRAENFWTLKNENLITTWLKSENILYFLYTDIYKRQHHRKKRCISFSLEKVSKQLATSVLSDGFMVVHNSIRGGEYKDTKLARGKQVVGPFFLKKGWKVKDQYENCCNAVLM